MEAPARPPLTPLPPGSALLADWTGAHEGRQAASELEDCCARAPSTQEVADIAPDLTL